MRKLLTLYLRHPLQCYKLALYFLFCRWLAKMFKSADDNKDGSLSFEECLNLLKQMNIKLRKSYAKKLFNVCDHF